MELCPCVEASVVHVCGPVRSRFAEKRRGGGGGDELPAGCWGFYGVGGVSSVPWTIKQECCGEVRRRDWVKVRGVRLIEGLMAWTSARAVARAVWGDFSGHEVRGVVHVTGRYLIES